MNVADILERAADWADEHGHYYAGRCATNGTAGIGADGSKCLIHSLVSIGAMERWDDVSAVLQLRCCTRWPVLWSDSTQQDEYTSTLRAVAAIERAKETQAKCCGTTVPVLAQRQELTVETQPS